MQRLFLRPLLIVVTLMSCGGCRDDSVPPSDADAIANAREDWLIAEDGSYYTSFADGSFLHLADLKAVVERREPSSDEKISSVDWIGLVIFQCKARVYTSKAGWSGWYSGAAAIYDTSHREESWSRSLTMHPREHLDRGVRPIKPARESLPP
jgi:hypothetical protein